MVNAGMLTIQENMGDDYYTLRIPNQEVWSAFRELTAFSLQIEEGDMQKLFMELIRGDIDSFAERYQSILLKAKRSGQTNIILKFKYTKDKKENLEKLAIGAVEQMKDKKYDMDMKQPIYYIGLAHCGKQAAVYYQTS